MQPTVAQLLRDHVRLSIACIDRLYINGYVPKLQTSGQLCYFMTECLGKPIPSPALLRPLHDQFVQSIRYLCQRQQIPLIQFGRGERKDDIVRPYRERFEASEGVVVIGVAQEKSLSFKATQKNKQGEGMFDFSRQSVFVNHYYFYLQDPDWGPAFIKIGSYLPYPVKLCLNGHEWVKQQMRRQGLSFESLDNGFLDSSDPQRLQRLCSQLGPQDIYRFFSRWSNRLPWPLQPEHRDAGYRHRLSLWQLEVSLTQVFDRPLSGRYFFEHVIRENLDLGRPDRVCLLFPHRRTARTPPPRRGYRTRVITYGVNPSLHLEYKSSHIKQYFKEEKALRTETTINQTTDFYFNKSLENLPQLRDIAHQANLKLLDAERLSTDLLKPCELDQLQRPSCHHNQKASALRFADLRVMALFHALCLFLHLPAGFRNAQLRRHVAALLGRDLDSYSSGAMTYDLRRLRLKGLIRRLPRSQRYVLTTFGIRSAYFYTRVHLRILRPGWAQIAPPPRFPSPLSNAFKTIDQQLEHLCAPLPHIKT